MKANARIVSGTIKGEIITDDNSVIEANDCIVGTLNMEMGFVISVIGRNGSIKYMLSNTGETNELDEEIDIDAMGE